MPTLAEATKAKCPKTDGLSFLPTLLGKDGQQQHEFMYWEYNGQTAVRMKNWKAYQKGKGNWELYDLAKDIEEKKNVAATNPKILEQLVAHAKTSHTPVRPGEIYNWALVTKDHNHAPPKPKRQKKQK